MYKEMKWKIKSSEEYLAQAKEKISAQEIKAFFIVFFAGIFLYVPMIVYRLNCSDGNVCGIIYRSHTDYDWEDYCGRYLLKYAAHMRSLFVFSWLAVILGLFFLALGSVLICRIFRIHAVSAMVVAGLFVIVSPCFTETFPFYFASDSYLLCFPLVIFAVYLLSEKQNWIRMLIGTGCLFISLALYQAYLFVAVVLFMFILLRELLKDEKSWKQIGRMLLYQAGCGFLSVAMYVGMNKLLKAVGLIYYQGQRFDFAAVFRFSVMPEILSKTYMSFFRYFFTMDFINNGWKGRYILNGIYFVIGGLLLVSVILQKKRSWKNKTAIIAATLALPLAFMGLYIINWQEGAPRIMMLPTAVLLYVGIWLFWVKKRSALNVVVKNWGGIVYYAVTAYLIFIMAVYIAIYQLCLKYYADKTDSLAQRIITRIEQEYPETAAGSPVFICGDVDEGAYPQNYRITQASFILNGTQACEGMFVNNMQGYAVGWNEYLNYNYGVEYQNVWNYAQEIYDSDFYKEMPLWPQKGCIQKTENGIVVVKLKE